MRFLHLQNMEGLTTTTVGWTWEDKEDVPFKERSKLAITFARVSPNDQFIKRKARWICEGRLKKGNKVVRIEKPKEQDLYALLVSEAKKYDQKCKEQYRKQA